MRQPSSCWICTFDFEVFSRQLRSAVFEDEAGPASQGALYGLLKASGAYRFDRYKSQGGRKKKEVEPTVALVGRQNVGKSTLFNRLIRERKSIVEDIPGVTRDRNYLDAEWEGRHFIVVDTGGFYPEPAEDIFLQIKEQALFAIEEGDVVIAAVR